MRRRLAADRVFVQIRIPPPDGVVPVSAGIGTPSGTNLLTRMRLLLRGKLLEHTTRIDVDAAHTMVALVLGYRDPSMDDISRAFADAGVAHLLAISGFHIAFLAVLAWALLRPIPMRPRRGIAVTVLIFSYALATPFGPPVMRASIVVAMVLISRILGRPRAYLNMLAAAAIIIVIIRPVDSIDAGFQLTFVCTTALVILAERMHSFLFSHLLERRQLIVDLGASPSARFRLRSLRRTARDRHRKHDRRLTDAPLVMFHFNQLNLYGLFTGLLEFPVVAFTMTIAIFQLALEGISSSAAATFAPVATGVAKFMIWSVKHLAAIPGAAIGVRSPPAWLVALMFVPVILWAIRRWLNFSRATLVNTSIAALTTVIAWYTLTAPLGTLQLQILSVSQGSSMILTTPRPNHPPQRRLRDLPNILLSAIAPALRTAGVRRIDALALTSLDALHANVAARSSRATRPRTTMTTAQTSIAWTLAASELETAINQTHSPLSPLRAGDQINLGNSALATILWPPAIPSTAGPMTIMLEFANRRILLLDSSNIQALTLLPLNHIDLHCDAVIIMNPERGAGDDLLRKLLPQTAATTIIWSGRTPWTPLTASTGTLNTADGCITLRIGGDGSMNIIPIASQN